MFWDDFVFRVVQGFGEGHSAGYPYALSVLERAHQRGLFTCEQLNALSLTLLLLACPVGSPLHAAAFAAQGGLPRDPVLMWHDLRETLPVYLVDLHRLARFREPRQLALLQGIFRMLYLPALVRFMSRAAQVSEVVVAPLAEILLLRIFQQAEPLDPTATRRMRFDDHFLVRLYRVLFRAPFPNAPNLAGSWPLHAGGWCEPPPDWRPVEGEPERRFLDSCLQNLEVSKLALIYLSFYAFLNIRQITLAVRVDRDWTAADTTAALREAWLDVLDGM